MKIEVRNLTKKYGSQVAVNQINFSLPEKGIIGFLGPNGAGKSTTMKMLTGYILPDDGLILANDKVMNAADKNYRNKIGYLSEANPLYYDMYIKEYLLFIANAQHVPSAEKRVEEVITLTGLTPEKHKKAGQLSKGYKQRLGLAAALIHDPEVLILDEPTTGLDPNQIIEIRQLIQKLGNTKTVLFSSHILQEVQAVCTDVIIINKGVIVANNSLDKLLSGKQNKFIQLELKEVLEDAWFYRLSSVIKAEKKDSNTWLLQTENEELTKKQVLAMSVEHNLNIVSLQAMNNNLEQIFRNLTKGSDTKHS